MFIYMLFNAKFKTEMFSFLDRPWLCVTQYAKNLCVKMVHVPAYVFV